MLARGVTWPFLISRKQPAASQDVSAISRRHCIDITAIHAATRFLASPIKPYLRPITSPSPTMKFALSNFLTFGGVNNKIESGTERKPKTTTLPLAKKRTYLACQRFVGKPMTHQEAKTKLESCKNFRDIVATEGDAIQNAIGLEYGSRLRSCVEQSNRVPSSKVNRVHYWVLSICWTGLYVKNETTEIEREKAPW